MNRSLSVLILFALLLGSSMHTAQANSGCSGEGYEVHDFDPSSGSSRGTAEDYADEAICLVAELEDYFDLEERKVYLQPILNAAAYLKAISQSRRDLSSKLQGRAKALHASLTRARGFAERNLEKKKLFPLMIEVMALEGKIDRDLE